VNVGVNVVPLAADVLLDGCCTAERLGYDSVWLGEHVLTPATDEGDLVNEDQAVKIEGRSYRSGSEIDADSPLLEPLIGLATIAGCTRSLRLGTCVAVLPLRDPFLTARAIATIDVLSRGRLDLGVGVGWLEEEFRALGRDFHRRGRCMDEFLHVLDLLFTERRPRFEGEFFSFGPMGFEPKPVQSPRPPMLIGGFSEAALRRAARYDGWFGHVTGADDVRYFTTELRRFRAEYGRGDEPFEVAAIYLGAPGPTELAAMEAAGLQRVVVTPWRTGPERVPIGRSRALDVLAEYAASIELSG
jgi:probable F420-dependent oxidoreductase